MHFSQKNKFRIRSNRYSDEMQTIAVCLMRRSVIVRLECGVYVDVNDLPVKSLKLKAPLIISPLKKGYHVTKRLFICVS